MPPARVAAVRLRLLFLAAAASCIAVVLVGCGGGGKAKIAGGAKVCETGDIPLPDSYEPSGEIIADSGFRPDTDGFGVENYGNCGQQNLTAVAMSDLFGPEQVCLSGSGPDCQLDPSAEKWMETTNEQMGGGHCMGFSVTALRFFSGSLDASTYGADETFDLEVKNNRALQSQIAGGWVYQFLPTVTSQELTGPPNAILQKIADSLEEVGSNRESAYSANNLYTIKIFNNEGGHAITPYAVEDKGDGDFAVLVYDNNYPGITRAIEFDTDANTWRYNAATRPGIPEALYTGDADHPYNMRLDPTGPGEPKPQPFDFTNSPNTGAGSAGSAGSTTLYNQISLLGNPENHAHLVLRDGKGHTTGFVNGKIVNEIPGVKVQQIATIDNWARTPEPNYLVPATMKQVQVWIDGSSLTKPDTETLTLIGQGFYTEVSDIKLTKGQQDFVLFTGDGKGFVYRTAPNHEQSPTVASAIAKGNGAYAFAAKAIGVKGGSQLTMYIEPKGAFVLNTIGTEGEIKKTGGYAAYVISLVHVTPQGEFTWVNGDTPILLKKDWQALIDFQKAPKPGQKVPVQTEPVDGGKSPIPIQFLEPQK
jgi:hypothetical protein